ncbi:hypothetical protein B0A48_03137 [Cryoendolithus antarcticus]|uniref:DUF155 domain-containing protein n=1 Tax=Cryoendolithus antarcticus TaxID=1507870 RepID=A0A1V8TM96_9PEZI|nr:hypothetical protein B0A48_03137 [Cryoendolithus antarcticus]
MSAINRTATWIAFNDICKRGLARREGLSRLATLRSTPTHSPIIATTDTVQRHALGSSHVSSSIDLDAGKTKGKAKPVRSHAAASSLRRVAAEAQRSRESIVKGHGRRRRINAQAEAKDVTAYCSAESYSITKACGLLEAEGYETDPLETGLYPQVLHVRVPATRSATEPVAELGHGDVFVFPSGSVVFWDVDESLALKVVNRVLLPAAENVHRTEVEDFEYLVDAHREHSVIVGDKIVLATKPASGDATSAIHENPISTTLAKIAYSSALARSTKLAALENSLSHYFSTTRTIPSILSSGSPLRFSRSFILRKTGELLSIRAQLNLYSELTDSLPDLFWDSPHELGLESYYEALGRALDVGVRIKVLNEKMDYASEIAAVLRERLSEKHSTGLEWLIIGLISIEVAFDIWEIAHEQAVSRDDDRTRVLLETWLETQVAVKR